MHPEWIPTAGFCAILNRILGALYYADYYSFIPVIDNWNNSAYEEENEIQGTYNVFEYYFEPVSDFSLVEVLQSRNTTILRDHNADLILRDSNVVNWYVPNDTYIKKLADIYKKYIKLNKNTEERIEREWQTLGLVGKTLGIHYRGTDYKLGVTSHPGSYSLKMFGDTIEKVMAEKEFDSIFLATDDVEAIEFFKSNYPNIKFYNDVIRSAGKISVAYIETDRESNHYKLGYEVLRDMYTLARCDGLIAGLSQVALTTQVIKKAKDEEYTVLKIIKTNIVKKGINWMTYFNKNLRKEGE